MSSICARLLIIACAVIMCMPSASALSRDEVQVVVEETQPVSPDQPQQTFDYDHKIDPAQPDVEYEVTRDPIKVFLYTRPAAVTVINEVRPERNRVRDTTIETTTSPTGSTTTVERTSDSERDSSVAVAVASERTNDDLVANQNFIVNRDDMIQVALNQLVNTQIFTVVNRENLDVMEAEIRRQRGANAAFDQQEIIERTKLLGANHFITITPLSNTDVTTAQANPFAVIMALSSIETGEVVASQQGIGPGAHNAIDDAATKLAHFVQTNIDRIAPTRIREVPKRTGSGL